LVPGVDAALADGLDALFAEVIADRVDQIA